VGSNAVARDAPFAIGSAACTTDDGQAWLDQGAHGATRLRVWPWEATAPTDVLTIPADRDPELVCAAARVFALAGGEEDVTATRALGGDAGAPVPILRTKDFPREDEREHDAYTVGDTLGLVRMGDSGTLALREWAPGGLGPWRTLQTKIAPDDDIVAVDADAESVVIVFTHEVGEGCGEGAATAVRALRVRRGSTDAGPSEAQLELGAPQCDRDPGPFWTGVVGGAVMVGWAERGHAPARRAEPAARTSDGGASEAGDSAGSGREASPAPIAGFSYAAVSDAAVDGAGSVPDGGKGPLAKHVDLTADEIVSAGCDKDRCYAAALIRPPGQDGMEPEAIRVLSYR
jgi:hypothetical protein